MTLQKSNPILIVARLKLGYSQQEVADLIDIAQSTYHNWESGKTKIASTKLLAVSKVLNIELSNLLS